MDVLTRQNDWIDVQMRPTDDLLKVWETRDLDIWSDELIHDIQRVLISRNAIHISTKPRSTTWREILNMPVIESFDITQIIKGEEHKKWSVNLLEDHALFFCEENGEVFSIDRDKSQEEFTFKRSGIFMQNESNAALVRGKLFDFSNNKEKLLSWMPQMTKKDLKGVRKHWGIIVMITGAFSLLFSSLLAPVWGSILVVLGLLYLLIPIRT